jgi:hypothetical protein
MIMTQQIDWCGGCNRWLDKKIYKTRDKNIVLAQTIPSEKIGQICAVCFSPLSEAQIATSSNNLSPGKLSTMSLNPLLPPSESSVAETVNEIYERLSSRTAENSQPLEEEDMSPPPTADKQMKEINRPSVTTQTKNTQSDEPELTLESARPAKKQKVFEQPSNVDKTMKQIKQFILQNKPQEVLNLLNTESESEEERALYILKSINNIERHTENSFICVHSLIRQPEDLPSPEENDTDLKKNEILGMLIRLKKKLNNHKSVSNTTKARCKKPLEIIEKKTKLFETSITEITVPELIHDAIQSRVMKRVFRNSPASVDSGKVLPSKTKKRKNENEEEMSKLLTAIDAFNLLISDENEIISIYDVLIKMKNGIKINLFNCEELQNNEVADEWKEKLIAAEKRILEQRELKHPCARTKPVQALEDLINLLREKKVSVPMDTSGSGRDDHAPTN